MPRLSVPLLAIASWGAFLPSAPALDLNADGLSDVWEQFYNLDSANPVADPDGDGQTNVAEAAAGTNPLDPDSALRVLAPRVEGGEYALTVSAQPGKRYRLFGSPTLDLPNWTETGTAQLATATTVEFRAALGATATMFFRVTAEDVDRDGDGVSDWEEQRLAGFDPNNPQSASPGQSDGVTLAQRLGTGPATLSLAVITPAAYEKENTPAGLRITRTGSLRALVVPLLRGGNASAQRGSVSASDYNLVDLAGNAVAGSVAIPFGASSVDLRVVPVADALREVPETLSLAIKADPSYQLGATSIAAVTIRDATPIPANERLLIAYLTPGAGVTSSASGISAVHLRGDNADALVDLSFNGLTSSQSAAHINAGGSGPDVKGLPRGQVEGSLWTIAAAQFLATDQAVLDALLAGQLTMNVLSGNYPDGEIRGNYVPSSGSANPPTPGAPPAVGALTGEALRRDVSRFLAQATFGPAQAELDALVADIEQHRGGDRLAGYAAWIDAQFALDQTSLQAYTEAADAQEWALRGTTPLTYTTATGEPQYTNRRRGWWTLSVKAHDELRQRLAFAWSEIFVVSENDSTIRGRHYGLANYYDMLGRFADGNYRQLLGEVSRHPIMGQYLSSLRNRKATVDSSGKVLTSPDENFAREVMQLFSIGLVQLNADGSVKLGAGGSPLPTYSNADITELARVLTGWSFSKTQGSKASGYPMIDNANFSLGSGPAYFQDAWTHPMKNFAVYHDTGAKTVLGTAIPAGLVGDQDLNAALDVLANHPNAAPFIARLLIQRLVTSNPSAGYIYRVAKVFANDGTGQRGNLRAVVKTILLDYEARTPALAAQVGSGKQKEPLLRYVQLLRAFGATSSLPIFDLSPYGYPATQLDNFPAGTTTYRYNTVDTELGQTPLRSPTVFNWFLPNYSPGGAISSAGLVAPELQLTTETQVVQAVNYARQFLDVDAGQSVGTMVGSTDATLDNIRVDRSVFVNRYKTLVAAGSTVTNALTTVLDEADLLLAGGRLKERYANVPGTNPRSTIISTAVATTETATSNDRVKVLLYLLATTPEFIHQP